ncbi:MAG: hypothetical protein ACRYFX_20640 [Janthinobacterium lividum]
MRNRRLRWAVLLLLVLLAAGRYWLYSTGSPRYKLYSPDKQCAVMAAPYRFEQLLSKMPGQAGDAAGKAFLVDEVTHKVVASAEIPMVSLADEIQWTDSTAYFIGDDYPNSLQPWKLPRPLVRTD